MSLNDEIGNFSKRREISSTAKKDDWDDEYDEDDWDEDEDNSLDFKMYNLGELDKYNAEAKELEELISPWWKNLRVIFTKEISSKIGLMDYKKKNLLNDDTFEEVHIRNVEDSLSELKVFSEILKKSYYHHFRSNIYGLLFYVPFIYWNGWSLIWYILVAWSLFDMGVRHFKYSKHKDWLVKAETFIHTQEGNELTFEPKETKDNKLATIMEFNDAIRKEENEHWSIKLYDAVANLFTRKK